MEAELIDKVKKRAQEKNISTSAFIRIAIINELDNKDRLDEIEERLDKIEKAIIKI